MRITNIDYGKTFFLAIYNFILLKNVLWIYKIRQWVTSFIYFLRNYEFKSIFSKRNLCMRDHVRIVKQKKREKITTLFLQLLYLTYYSYTIIEHPFYKSFHDVTTTPQIILFILKIYFQLRTS